MPVLGSGGAGALRSRGTWAAGTVYAVGDVTTWQARVYGTTTAHTAGADFDRTKFVDLGQKDLGAARSAALMLYGSSFVANGGGGASTGYGYPTIMKDVLGNSRIYGERGVEGNNVGDTAWKIATTAGPDIGLVTMDAVVNSVDTPSAKKLAAMANGMRAFIDLARGGAAAHRILHTDGGMAFTGTWSSIAHAHTSFNGRTYRQSTTLNDTFTVTWTGDAVTILLVGRDDSANGTAGAAYSILNGATVIASGTLSDQALVHTGGAFSPLSLGLVPVRLSGFGSGSHTVTVKKTDASGSALAVDCAVPPLAAPPLVVIVKGCNLPLTGLRPGNNANLPSYNSILDAEVASPWLPAGHVISVDPSLGNSWNNALTFTDVSGLHPNDAGHQVYAGAILEAISSMPYRPGFTGASFLDLNPGAT